MSDKADNKQLEVVYVYRTENTEAVENCLKAVMKTKQYRHHKEIYQIDLEILKEVINKRCGITVDKVTKTPNGGAPKTGMFAVIFRD